MARGKHYACSARIGNPFDATTLPRKVVDELTLFSADLSICVVEIDLDRSISRLGCASLLEMYNYSIQLAGYMLSELDWVPKV